MSGFLGESRIEILAGVSSVNNRIGAVTLSPSDVSAIPISEKGAANGVCDLDGSGLVPILRIPVLPQSFKGTWDAYDNEPVIVSGVGTNGDYYLVDTAGSTDIDGYSDWEVGDMIIYDGVTHNAWEKVGRADAVTSVAGKVGVVTLVLADVGITDADDIPDGSTNRFASSDQKDALDGTDGVPSNTNKFVTNSDSRMTNSRAPTGPAAGELAGTYPNPTLASHASKHLPDGSDPLTSAAPSSVGSTNTEGTANSFARSDHVHSHSTQAGGTLHAAATTGANGFMSSADKTKLDGIPETGEKYAPSATDPVTPSPIGGDTYYNTALGMLMMYDGIRSKWLSAESITFAFGRNSNTAAGSYYRSVDGMAFSATKGFPAFYNGTIISLGYTRDTTSSATFQVTADGSTISSLVSTAVTGTSLTLNDNFSQNTILGVRNAVGGATTNAVLGWVRLRWRV